MARITLITGGARSGKSDFAQMLAEGKPGPHCFVATCEERDEEMAKRIEKHRRTRSENIWDTIEEPINLISAFKTDDGYRTYLVDCLTLWVSNCMSSTANGCEEFDEDAVIMELQRLKEVLDGIDCNIVFVTNEVGMGIVPENRIARLFRDVVGRCNRTIAGWSSEVILVSCGLPIHLKKEEI